MTYIMGVDGGNSKTYTVITDLTGKKVGTGIAGCGNHQVNLGLAIKNIGLSIEQALKHANLRSEDIEFVQYGLAGADRETDFRILREALETFPFKKWDVVCDTLEGLRTGSLDNVGVVLVCGSGTNAAGRNLDGQMVQTGGFGYMYGDGIGVGGHSLAVEAFRAAIRSWELRESPTLLTKLVPEAMGYPTVEAMFNGSLDQGLARVPASLSIVLHQAAEKGDAVSIKILENCGKELGIACLSIIRRLGLGSAVEEKPMIPVVLVGSVIQKGRSPYLLGTLRQVIEEAGYRPHFVIPSMAPVYGALLIGMDQLGIQPTESLMTQFSEYGGYQDEKR